MGDADQSSEVRHNVLIGLGDMMIHTDVQILTEALTVNVDVLLMIKLKPLITSHNP